MTSLDFLGKWANKDEKFEKLITYLTLLMGLITFAALITTLIFVKVEFILIIPASIFIVLMLFNVVFFRLLKKKQQDQIGPVSVFGKFMVGSKDSPGFIDKYENNVLSFVYAGAALLVIIVGLRGLGPVVGEIFSETELEWLLDFSGSIEPKFIIGGLLIEFAMILLLATVMFFKEEENGKKLGGRQPAEEYSAEVQINIKQIKSFRKNIEAFSIRFEPFLKGNEKLSDTIQQADKSLAEIENLVEELEKSYTKSNDDQNRELSNETKTIE